MSPSVGESERRRAGPATQNLLLSSDRRENKEESLIKGMKTIKRFEKTQKV